MDMGWIYFVLSILGAAFFYWLRSRHQILYGVSELLVSFLILYLLFVPSTPDFLVADGEWSAWFFPLTKTVSFLLASMPLCGDGTTSSSGYGTGPISSSAAHEVTARQPLTISLR